MAVDSPIPARGPLHPAQFAGLVGGITGVYHAAGPEMQHEGKLWYPKAHDIATKVGKSARIHSGSGSGGIEDHVRGAGIISALSPQMGWEQNVALAHDFARHGRAAGKQTGDNLDKAEAIRDGEHPLDVLKPKGSRAHKTENFFKNIADPSNPHPVTIDRHAHDLALGRSYTDAEDRGLGAAGRYNHFADAYRAAAHNLGVEHAHEVQASTWVKWRADKAAQPRQAYEGW
jgi:hypothetical protein